MGLTILLLIISIPIIEIMVFIDIGERIGLLNTVFIIILTTIIGFVLLRSQGLSILFKAQASLKSNTFPLEEVFEGLCVICAGAMLLTPGFVTDVFGILLFLPLVRLILKGLCAKIFLKRADFNETSHYSHLAKSNDVIDGDFHHITKNDAFDKIDNDEKSP